MFRRQWFANVSPDRFDFGSRVFVDVLLINVFPLVPFASLLCSSCIVSYSVSVSVSDSCVLFPLRFPSAASSSPLTSSLLAPSSLSFPCLRFPLPFRLQRRLRLSCPSLCHTPLFCLFLLDQQQLLARHPPPFQRSVCVTTRCVMRCVF